ncbi:MAG TPA: proprotein convertase P-domain-containing protein [Candidatus Acidoferrum sp.]|jgi:uncharacterized repeat protein (TIGR01451 family)|nr:proprotein convertase P-domain-containing protein [Candidatus Acidoferrum sp.]
MKLTIERLFARRSLCSRALFLAAALAGTLAASAEPLSESALNQITALRAEKESRSFAQQKMDSHLVYALKQSLHQPVAPGVGNLRLNLKTEADGRVWVDLKATITPQLLNDIRAANGTVLNSFPQYNATRILIPLAFAETLAGRSDVQFVQSAVQAATRTGSVDSEGDVTHSAITARPAFRVDGSGVKVGVLSDSVDFMAQAQSSGDLPPDLVVLPGQSGVPGSGEGTAMLEIVYDLAPGSKLFFATANGGPAQFARNIRDLRSAGCDIIVDDVGYFDESPFQDGIIAQAVNSVTASGALYFSSAGNEGSKRHGTSGTWEGDFVDGGPAGAPVNGKGGNLLSFGATTYDTAVQPGFAVILLWSDPLGLSTNDYDLYVLDTNGVNVVSSSTTIQNGSQDPFEIVPPANPGERIVVVKASGDPRFLHIDTIRGQLLINTDGNITGHPCATNAFAVSAVDIHTSFPNPFAGGPANPVEFFSTDGPRRVFYNADGTPITPGNFLSTGGYVRAKPDITAADGVSTTLPPFSGLNPFFGTSAAAPHAAAIAALLESYNPELDPAQIRTVLTGTALDNEAPGYDFNSGYGIVMADLALGGAPLPRPLPALIVATNFISGGNGNGIIEFNECNNLDVVLTNVGRANATGVRVSVTTTTPGVIIAQPNSPYPNIATNNAATNFTSFKVSTAPDFNCGIPIDLTILVKCDQVVLTNQLTLPTGVPGIPLRFDSFDQVFIPDVGATNSIIVVSNVTFALSKFTVSMFISHTFDRDLILQLVSPDGMTNTLATHLGGGGQNYGLACSPDSQRTTFDDSATNFIGGSFAPFVGSFKPEQPLANFAGKAGTNVNGPWQLLITDTALRDVGTLHCWALTMTPTVCTNGGGECPGSDLAIGMVASPQPVIVGANLKYTISVTNNGPSTAKNVSVSQVLPSNTIFVSATASQGSAAQAGGVVSADLGQMSAGGTATVTVIVIPATVGTISSSANVTSEQPDFNLANNTATVFSTVNPPTSDLAVRLVAAPSALVVGGNLTYTLLLTNNGPSDASGVFVTNVLPPGVLLLGETSSEGSLALFGNTVVCSFGSLTNGGVASAIISATPVSEGTLAATATVVGNQVDPVAANNTSTALVIVGPAADLALTLTARPSPVVLSSNLTYFAAVTNFGPSTATNVVLTETLPAGVNVVSVTLSQGTYVINGSTLTASLGALASGRNASLTVIVATTRLGTLTCLANVTASLTDPNSANNSASVSVSVAQPFVNIVAAGASLTAESFSPPNGSIDPDETVTLQLRLQNLGNVVNTNLTATLQASGGVTPITVNPQTYGVLKPIGVPGGVPVARSFSLTASGAGGANIVVTLQLLDGSNPLPPVTFTFPLPTFASFSNTNLILVPDPNRIATFGDGPAFPYPSTNFVSGLTGQVSKVTVSLFGLLHTFPHDISVLLVGPTTVNTLLLSHADFNSSLSSPVDLTFDDNAPSPLPASGPMSSGSWQPSAYAPAPVFSNPAPAAPFTAMLSTFNGLNPNGTWSVYVLDDGSGDTGSIAGGWSINFTNVTPVNQVVDLGLSLVAAPNPVFVGSNLTYTFTITNAGPNSASGVTFSNALPANVTLVGASTSQGSLTTNGNVIIGNLASLSVGATATVTLVVQPGIAAAGSLTESALITSFETDLHSVNNTASTVTTVVLPTADLGLTLSANPVSVIVGSNLTYSIVVTNGGPGNALSSVVTLPLPATLAYGSASASQGSVAQNGASVIATLGDLGPGALATVTINVTPLSPGLLTNTASVATASIDPASGNNSASAVVAAASPAPHIVAAGATLITQNLLNNGAINPGQTVTISFGLANIGQLDTANLVATLQASGGVTAPGGPDTYGQVVAGGPPVARAFAFTVSPSAAGAIVATLQLQDGANNLGLVTFTFTLPLTTTYASTNSIVIPDQGPASPYPSAISVSGLTGFVSKATVTLSGLTHGFASDVNVLLVSPGGSHNVLLMSHASGNHGLTNLTLTFDDAAAAGLPANGILATGTYLPSQYGATPPFIRPAPAAPFGSTLGALNGAGPNGAWSLFVLDDSAGDSGIIARGWSLTLTTVVPVNPVADLAVGMSGSPASLFTGSSLTYTLNITNLGPNSVPDVVVIDTLPGGVNVTGTTSSQGTVAIQGNTLTATLGLFNVGGTANITINTAPAIGGILVNTATVSSSATDLNPANDSASVTTVVAVPVPAQLVGAFTNGQFLLTVSAQPGMAYIVEASTNLKSWSSLGTFTAPFSGVFQVIDPAAPAPETRFYRTIRVIP